jgi:hypothetical protein
VEIFPHQIRAAMTVISDPVQRYLLADEVGLGKTIEVGYVIRQVLLQIGLGVELQHLPQIANRHQWHLDLPKQGIINPDRQRQRLGAVSSQSAVNALEMLAEQIRRHRFLVDRRVLESKIDETESLAAPLQMNGFGGAPAQIDSDNLIAPFGPTANEWQTHIEIRVCRRSAKRGIADAIDGLCQPSADGLTC